MMIRFLLAPVLLASFLSAQNVRLGFPQIVVGEGAVTEIVLENRGVGVFRGFLAVVDDQGSFLPVAVNGVPVADFLDLSIPARRSLTFELTSTADLQAGHVIVWDDREVFQPPGVLQLTGNGDVNSSVSGTAVYRITDAEGALIDSIGVPQSLLQEGFFFPAETGTARTGVALSNPGRGLATVTMRVFFPSGQLAGSHSFLLDSFEHQAFFIDERFPLGDGFRGTVEVESRGAAVFATALRQEGFQLSAVSVRGLPLFYDFRFTGGSTLSGRMALEIHEGRVIGSLRFDQRPSDPAVIIQGSYIESRMVISLISAEGEVGAIVSMSFPWDEDVAGTGLWDFRDIGFIARRR